jgi:hypothetical protein
MLRVEHARGVFLPGRRRRGRREFGGLEQSRRDLLAGQLVAEAAGPEPRVVANEPNHAQGEGGGEASDRHDIDRPEARPARRAPNEHKRTAITAAATTRPSK